MSEVDRYRTHEPENLQERFAHRAAHMKPSEIRSLFAVASRPEIVSLAGGMPNLSAIPMGVMASLVEKLVIEHGQEALREGAGCCRVAAGPASGTRDRQLATAGWPEASYAAGSLDDAHTKRATLVTDDSLALISTFHEDR